jgi:hypothetical protein
MPVNTDVVSRPGGRRARVVQRAGFAQRRQCCLDDFAGEAFSSKTIGELPRRQFTPAQHQQAGRDRRARRQV